MRTNCIKTSQDQVEYADLQPKHKNIMMQISAFEQDKEKLTLKINGVLHVNTLHC